MTEQEQNEQNPKVKQLTFIGRVILDVLCANNPSLADELHKQCDPILSILYKECKERRDYYNDLAKRHSELPAHLMTASNSDYFLHLKQFEEVQMCTLNMESLRVVIESYRQLLMQKTQQALVDRTEKGIEVQQQLAKAAIESASKQDELVRASLESAKAQEVLAKAALKSAEEQKELSAWTKSLVKATIVVAVVTALPLIVNLIKSLLDWLNVLK